MLALTPWLALCVFSSPTYAVRQIEGWSVHVRTELLERDQAVATEKALKLLANQLVRVKKVVPAKAVKELKKVRLYFSPTYPSTVPSAAYHPGEGWLKENGRDPAMVKSVEFTNIAIFEPETRRMPAFVLHELAHAYHDQVLPDGFGNAEIRAAFEKAKGSGAYDRVERRDSEGKITLEKAYAMTNPMEYFAETTEAYFHENDFYPFTSSQLKQVDPGAYALLGKLWNSK